MSRNKSNTETVREQYEYHRHDMKKRLASQILSIVGIRYFRAQPYVTTKDNNNNLFRSNKKKKIC